MAEIRRNRFAFLVTSLFKEYERIRNEKNLPIPKTILQPDYLGYEKTAEIKGIPEINSDNCTLSHIIYFSLKDSYDFRKKGFRDPQFETRMPIQGAVLRKAINDYSKQFDRINIGDNYLDAYLTFLGWSKEDFEAGFNENKENQSLTIQVPWTIHGPKNINKINPTEDVPLEYDIFLASPKLTLGHKIKITFGKFRKTVKAALGRNFSKRIENILIKHFFGFVPKDLEKEYEVFEEYINKLKSELTKKGFKIYDSREEKTIEDIDSIGHAPTQLKKDIKAIVRSKTYILVSPYPRLFSSAWVEAGAAISMGKPCKFICSDRKTDLPFILQDRSSQHEFDVVEYRGMATKSIDNKIKFTIKVITEWAPFRCEECHGKSGPVGHIGEGLCPACEGHGYFTASRSLQ